MGPRRPLCVCPCDARWMRRGPARGGARIVTFSQTLLERAAPRAPLVPSQPTQTGSTATASGQPLAARIQPELAVSPR